MLAAAGGQTWEDRIERTLPAWKGAFSLVLLAADRVIAVRDPWGFRPLSVGRLPHGGYAVASETCALSHARLRRHQRGRSRARSSRCRAPRCTAARRWRRRPTPGALHVRVRLLLPARLGVGRPQRAPRPPAPRRGAGRRVAGRRRRRDPGARLARSRPPSATRRASGIPFNDGLIKNRYIGRTFIEPTQDIRERGVALKFNALAENLAGKRVVMIDDSLVRGTTAGPARQAGPRRRRHRGAPADHLPADHAPCHFGVDMGHDGDLMAARLTVERDPRPHRCRQPGVPVARRDDARHRSRRRRRRRATATPASPVATRCRVERGRRPSWRSRACWPMTSRSVHRRRGPRARRSPGRAGSTATRSTVAAELPRPDERADPTS